MKTTTKLLGLAVAAMSLTGCMDWWPEFGIPAGKEPWGEINPIQGMHSNPSYKDQEKGAVRYLPPGTVPANFQPTNINAQPNLAPELLKNPVAMTDESMAYGKLMYETACLVCHGTLGKGDGPVPSNPNVTTIAAADLTAAPIRNQADGELFNTITNGKASMWAYKSQLKPEERWAVVNYIRALQRAEYPEPQDTEIAD